MRTPQVLNADTHRMEWPQVGQTLLSFSEGVTTTLGRIVSVGHTSLTTADEVEHARAEDLRICGGEVVA